jgi:hypothetical protein
MSNDARIFQSTIQVQIEPMLLRREEAARVLGVSPRLFDDLVLAGLISKVKVGGVVAFDPDDLRAFVRQAKRGGFSTAQIRGMIAEGRALREAMNDRRTKSRANGSPHAALGAP